MGFLLLYYTNKIMNLEDILSIHIPEMMKQRQKLHTLSTRWMLRWANTALCNKLCVCIHLHTTISAHLRFFKALFPGGLELLDNGLVLFDLPPHDKKLRRRAIATSTETWLKFLTYALELVSQFTNDLGIGILINRLMSNKYKEGWQVKFSTQ